MEKHFWAIYNRKWYIAKEAREDETPDKLKKKLPKDKKIMKFLGDPTYSAVPFSRIQPFGKNKELDIRRGARDRKDINSQYHRPLNQNQLIMKHPR